MVYTSVLGPMVLSYPRHWSVPIAIAVALVFLVVTGVGFWSGRVTIGGLSVGVVTWLFSAAASALLISTGLAVGIVTWLFAVVAWNVLAQAFRAGIPDVMTDHGQVWIQFDVLILTMCSAVVLAVILALERRAARRRSLEELALGAACLVAGRWRWPRPGGSPARAICSPGRRCLASSASVE